MTNKKIIEYKKSLKNPYTGMTKGLKDKIDGIEIKEEKIDLDSMNKDELNDYAVTIGLTTEVNPTMKKQEMIDIIKKSMEGDK